MLRVNLANEEEEVRGVRGEVASCGKSSPEKIDAERIWERLGALRWELKSRGFVAPSVLASSAQARASSVSSSDKCVWSRCTRHTTSFRLRTSMHSTKSAVVSILQTTKYRS